ncbi:cobalamin-binding protein [Vibrio azureus]|uniref:Vitamin B12-binding protein n=1 Tax=Vibrio azureus NBRC 104587 TaxID=1219077 RepID=U3ASC7_9VIBR|nr:vitamin B12 ABC transporter substrate-binding protein BtuF [Vibrio azureus]AUI85302.1 cobalamin-binding protein [Vibrio azureus]GAD76157.1 vitamin B12-binding protein [Vibrio azureus NBRC 104587]
MNPLLLALPAIIMLFSAQPYAHTEVQKVISLSPHATELAYAAGLGDKLIAVSEMSDYPQQAKQLETVSNYQGIKLERILTLKPDLVLAWPEGNPTKELEKLAQFGIPIYDTTAHSLEDIAKHIEQLSVYTEKPEVGQKAAANFRAQLELLQTKYQTNNKVRYFYQISDKPLMTVTGHHWPSEVFHFCGGENIFESSLAPYPQVNLEQVILRQPEALFVSRQSVGQQGIWNKWKPDLIAFQNGHVWSPNRDWLNRQTPRTLQAVKEVCEYFERVRQKR